MTFPRDWLNDLRQTDAAAFQKCVAAISRLAELGHELRRPLADILRDGIHELRIRCGRVNYRILYFFHESARGHSRPHDYERRRCASGRN